MLRTPVAAAESKRHALSFVLPGVTAAKNASNQSQGWITALKNASNQSFGSWPMATEGIRLGYTEQRPDTQEGSDS